MPSACLLSRPLLGRPLPLARRGPPAVEPSSVTGGQHDGNWRRRGGGKAATLDGRGARRKQMTLWAHVSVS